MFDDSSISDDPGTILDSYESVLKPMPPALAGIPAARLVASVEEVLYKSPYRWKAPQILICDDDSLDEGETVHVALGARGSELFVASYRVSNGYLNEEHAPRVCDSAIFLRDHAAGITVAGSEAVQHVLVETRDSIADSSSLDDHAPVAVVAPHSRYAPTLMRNPAATYRVEDVSSFEPRYMRAFEARKPAKSIFDRLPF